MKLEEKKQKIQQIEIIKNDLLDKVNRLCQEAESELEAVQKRG